MGKCCQILWNPVLLWWSVIREQANFAALSLLPHFLARERKKPKIGLSLFHEAQAPLSPSRIINFSLSLSSYCKLDKLDFSSSDRDTIWDGSSMCQTLSDPGRAERLECKVNLCGKKCFSSFYYYSRISRCEKWGKLWFLFLYHDLN